MSYSPEQVVLNHRDHSMRQVLLAVVQCDVQVLCELLAQLFDDHGAVSDLLTIQLYERQLALFRAVFHFVVHVLEHNREFL